MDNEAKQINDFSDSPVEQGDSQPDHLLNGSSSLSSVESRPKRRKKSRQTWTAEEDEALVNGHRLYGFQWALMAQDPSLKFINRTGPQVRDRFRLKFPEIYAQEAAVPIDPRTYRNGKIKPGGGRAASREIKKPLTDNSEPQELDNNEDSEPHSQESRTTSISNSSSTTTAPYSITDLLNEVSSEDDRPMAGAASYLDEEEDNRAANSPRYDYCDLTLPPLVLNWEDMATRPIFELE